MATDRILCISTYEKGQDLMRQCAEMGCAVVLLTTERLRHANWPFEVLEEFCTMPEELTLEQVTNTVTYMARGKRFDRIVALDEFDMEMVAHLREHMRVPGMGRTTTTHFRDKLAMRFEARRFAELAGVRVPAFCGVLHYDDLRAFMAEVPGPWVLKPRAEASAIGIRKIHEPEQLWRTLDELGDRQSYYLLEQFIPGDVYHVDAITSERKVVFTAVSRYGKPPMQVMHEGGVFTTRLIDRRSAEAQALTAINELLMPAMGMVRGVTHTEYILGADGGFYFLEAAARVGGAFIADVVRFATGVDLWREWGRIEVCSMRAERYEVPVRPLLYAGSVLCLARTGEPDTQQFEAPEVVYRMKKPHHAGLIVQSPDPERVRMLLEEYSARFAQEYLAIAPPPEKPTA